MSFSQDGEKKEASEESSQQAAQLLFALECSTPKLEEVPRKQANLRTLDSMLLMGIIKGDLSELNSAYNQGASLSFRTGADAETPCIIASRWGLCGVVTWLINQGGVGLLKARTNSGLSALLGAASENQLSTASFLLSCGADSEEANVSGSTSLLVACQHNHKRIVKLLLGHGASMICADNDGTEPAMMAAAKGHIDILRLLLERSQLQGQKIDLVSRTNKKGWTALFFAAAGNQLECAALLFTYGSNSKAKDAEKLTADNVWGSLVKTPPLSHEARFNRRHAFRAAEQAHADLLAKREEGWHRKKNFVTFLSGHRLVGPRKLSFEFKTRRQKAAQTHILRVFCSDSLLRLITKFL